MEEKTLLKKLGEETIYSAKGHFKACDLRRNLVTYTIWICALLNIIGLLDFNAEMNKVLSVFGLVGTISLLIWNEGEGKDYRSKHKMAGEAYLALHKKIRTCYFLTDCSSKEVETLAQEVSLFDQTIKPEIPGIARWSAKRAIESNDPETDNWYKK